MRNQRHLALDRRAFLAATSVGLGGLLLPRALQAAPAGAPTHNPVARLKLAWTDSILWSNVVDITQVPGADPAEKLAAAQAALAAKGGGVVYFPPGVHRFKESIHLLDGIVLRGAEPGPVTKAHDENYAPPSRILAGRLRPRISCHFDTSCRASGF